jgi:hypothetical protein
MCKVSTTGKYGVSVREAGRRSLFFSCVRLLLMANFGLPTHGGRKVRKKEGMMDGVICLSCFVSLLEIVPFLF